MADLTSWDERLATLYDSKLGLYERSRGQLEHLLVEFGKDLAEQGIRIRLIESRVKELQSASSKAARFGWSSEENYAKLGDMVGARVVLFHQTDVEGFLEALMKVPSRVLRILSSEEKDNEGYRAFHLDVEIYVPVGTSLVSVRCEIQLRTELQDTWAILAHDDIYKRHDSPQVIKDMFVGLAQQLDAVQGMADNLNKAIKQDAERQRRLRAPLLAKLSAAFTAAELEEARDELAAMTSSLDFGWVTLLETRLREALGEFGDDLELAVNHYDRIWRDVRQDFELRARALIARSGFIDKGYGWPGIDLIQPLKEVAAAYKSAAETDLVLLASQAWLQLGELERHRGNWGNARTAYEESQRLAKEKANGMVAQSLHRLAIIARMEGKERLSGEFLARAMDVVAEAQEFPHLLGAIRRDMGIHELQMYKVTESPARLDEADAHLRAAYKVLSRGANKSEAGICLAKRGRVLIYKKDLESAEIKLTDALDLITAGRNRLYEAQVWSDLARLKLSTGETDIDAEENHLRELSASDQHLDKPLQSAKYLARVLWYRGQNSLRIGELVSAARDFLEDLALSLGRGTDWEIAVSAVARSVRESGDLRENLAALIRSESSMFPQLEPYHIELVLTEAEIEERE